MKPTTDEIRTAAAQKRNYYFVCGINDKRTILRQGLKADINSQIFLFDKLETINGGKIISVADSIAMSQLLQPSYSLFTVDSRAIHGNIYKLDTVDDCMTTSRWAVEGQTCIDPDHIFHVRDITVSMNREVPALNNLPLKKGTAKKHKLKKPLKIFNEPAKVNNESMDNPDTFGMQESSLFQKKKKRLISPPIKEDEIIWMYENFTEGTTCSMIYRGNKKSLPLIFDELKMALDDRINKHSDEG